MSNGRQSEPVTREQVLALLRESIGERIRPVVRHLPEPSVADLIDQMARLRFKWEGVAALRATPPRPGRGPAPD